MRWSLYNNSRAIQSLLPVARTNGTANGTSVDLNQNLDASRSAMLVVSTGAITDGSHAITLQESSDNSAWSTVAAVDLQGTPPTITATDDNKVFEVGYLGSKRYLRAVATTSGATSGGIFDALILRGFVRRPPISHA